MAHLPGAGVSPRVLRSPGRSLTLAAPAPPWLLPGTLRSFLVAVTGKGVDTLFGGSWRLSRPGGLALLSSDGSPRPFFKVDSWLSGALELPVRLSLRRTGGGGALF
jgi:hypothetical protein